MAKKNEDSNITVLAFDDIIGAENMLDNVNTWQEAGMLTVVDAVIVTRAGGSSDVEIKQTEQKSGKWVLGGSGVGLLAGILLGGPIGGLVVGAVLGGITGAMRDYGIDDKFVRQVSEGMVPESSALFLMTDPVEGRDDEELYGELRSQKARVLSTTLPADQEERLRQLLNREE